MAAISRTFRSRIRPALAFALLLPGLAACNTKDPLIVGSIPDDYRTRHPIVIGEGVVTMDVPVASGQGVLSEDVQGNITGFAKEFWKSGARTMAILVPIGSANQRAAATAAAQIRQLLEANGIPKSALEMRSYGAAPSEASAAVRLAYSKVVAKTAACGPWADQVADTTENRNYKNFGCASQANLAAMVVNPVDLVHPREMAAPDAERRSQMLEKYRSGEPYQSDYSRANGGSVATGVGN